MYVCIIVLYSVYMYIYKLCICIIVVLCIIRICIHCMYVYVLYVCLCMLQCGRTALPNTGVENYKSINQSGRPCTLEVINITSRNLKSKLNTFEIDTLTNIAKS